MDTETAVKRVNCETGDDNTFVNKLLGEMKSQFNKAELNIEYIQTARETNGDSLNSSQKGDVEIDKRDNMSTNNAVEIKEDSEDYGLMLMFKKPEDESLNRNKECDTSSGKRSLRQKNNKMEENVLKRSSRRRSKDCNESVLQSAIARKEKSYNESNKPQRLSRQLKPTQKILENLALAKQEKNKVKLPRNLDSDLLLSDDTNSIEIGYKRFKRHISTIKKSTKQVKIDETDQESESDESFSADSEPTVEVFRRSKRLSSRNKEELNTPDSSPNVADQANYLENNLEGSSIESQLIVSKLCLCTQNTNLFIGNNDKDIYCNAVDSIGEKLIGCSRIVDVEKTPLLRPSQRVPYIALCDLHRNRLLRHNCCPTCGIFCTQGCFVECDNKHQFHRNCQIFVGNLDCCPHCGISTPSRNIYIKMHCSTKPVFLPIQKDDQHPAKMSFTKTGDHSSSLSPPLLPIETFQIFNTPHLKFDEFTENDLIEAIKDEDIDKLASIVASNTVNLHFKISDFNDGTLIHYAALKGLLTACHLLVTAGLEIDAFDKEQNTPLMLAINAGRNEVVQYLIRSGADISVKGTDGMSPLHIAAKSGNLDACRVLLDAGMSLTDFPNRRDDGGWTPLVWACEHGHSEVVSYLIAKGADTRLRDVEYNEALHWAAFSGRSSVVQMLLNTGVEVDTVNAHGETPLHIAAREDKYNSSIVLLARGASVTVINKNNETPLDCAPVSGDCYHALALNSKLQSLISTHCRKFKTILNNDVSKGREVNPIQCVNTIDEELEPRDYIYITKNCLTSPQIQIDTKIDNLQSCSCAERCTKEECECGKLSVKCWYDEEGKLVPDFNFSDAPMIFECNDLCACNAITCRNRVVQRGLQHRFQVYKTASKGWGVKTLRFIPRGSYVCEYIGEILTDVEANSREDDSFLFDLDNKELESYCMDAKRYGNFARFINHSCIPNLYPVKVFVEHHDLRFPRIAFFAFRDITADEELNFDYGHKFWLIKYKSFTCRCCTDECKYSEETISRTLINYKLMGAD